MPVINVKLSPIESKTKIGETEISVREIEKAILTSLAQVAWQNVVGLKDSNICADMYSQFEAIDKEENISLSEEDLKKLITAWDKTAGQRPAAWMSGGRDLMKQLI